MARIRSLHPSQWTDDEFVACSPLARLLALAIRNEADDNGIFEINPVKIKLRLLPADNCDVNALLAELTQHNQFYEYVSGGKRYGIIRSFDRFQSPKKPTYFHPIPEPVPTGYVIKARHFPTSSPPVPHQFRKGTELDGQKGSGSGSGLRSKAYGAKKTAPIREYPEDFEKAWTTYPSRTGSNPKAAAYSAWKARVAEGVSVADLLVGVERFRAFCDATDRTGTEFVMQAKRFFGTGREYAQSWTSPTQLRLTAQANGRPEPPMPKPFPRLP